MEDFQLFTPRNKPYRRKRTSEGATWAPEQELRPDKGLHCRNCRRQIPWKKLSTEYEHQSADLFRLWVCECGNILREDNLTDLGIVYELRSGEMSDTFTEAEAEASVALDGETQDVGEVTVVEEPEPVEAEISRSELKFHVEADNELTVIKTARELANKFFGDTNYRLEIESQHAPATVTVYETSQYTSRKFNAHVRAFRKPNYGEGF